MNQIYEGAWRTLAIIGAASFLAVGALASRDRASAENITILTTEAGSVCYHPGTCLFHKCDPDAGTPVTCPSN